MTKETGGFAFAYGAVCTDGGAFQEGMTLRDWFAGQALQGLMLDERFLIAPDGKTPAQHIADNSYDLADAMIEARKS